MFKFYMNSLNGVVSDDVTMICFVFLMTMTEVIIEGLITFVIYICLKGRVK